MDHPFSIYINGYCWGKARGLSKADKIVRSIALLKYQTALVVHDPTYSVCSVYWMNSSGQIQQVSTEAAKAWNEPDDTLQPSAE